MKYRFKTLAEIWAAIDAGRTVYWHSPTYQVLPEPDSVPHKHLYSERDGIMLRVTCLSNWFGSRLEATEIGSCYVETEGE